MLPRRIQLPYTYFRENFPDKECFCENLRKSIPLGMESIPQGKESIHVLLQWFKNSFSKLRIRKIVDMEEAGQYLGGITRK
jgi:hypothetical protein